MAQFKIKSNGINTLKVCINILIGIDLDYDPLLINCFEGLLETEHPYALVSSRALIELLEAEGSA